MEEFDSPSDIFSRPGAGDDKLYVQFYMSFVKDEAKSLEEGRPVFKDTEFCKIICPGDRLNIIDRPATVVDKKRFSKHYAAFKQDSVQRVDGTPLTEWPVVTRGMAEELKYFGFITVEQLAGANDTNGANLPMFHTLKAKAAAYLELAKGSTAPIETLTKKLEESDMRNKAMQESLDVLQAQVRALSKAPSKAAVAA